MAVQYTYIQLKTTDPNINSHRPRNQRRWTLVGFYDLTTRKLVISRVGEFTRSRSRGSNSTDAFCINNNDLVGFFNHGIRGPRLPKAEEFTATLNARGAKTSPLCRPSNDAGRLLALSRRSESNSTASQRAAGSPHTWTIPTAHQEGHIPDGVNTDGNCVCSIKTERRKQRLHEAARGLS